MFRDFIKTELLEAYDRSISVYEYKNLALLTNLIFFKYIDETKISQLKAMLLEDYDIHLELSNKIDDREIRLNTVDNVCKAFILDRRDSISRDQINSLLLQHNVDRIIFLPHHFDREYFKPDFNLCFNFLWFTAIKNKATDIHIITETDTSNLKPKVGIYFRQGMDLNKQEFFSLSVDEIYSLAIYIIEKQSQNTGAKDYLRLKAETRVAIKDNRRTGRVSIVQGAFGYSTVIRILEVDKPLQINQLGFYKDLEEALHRAALKDRGLTIACGRFGSGKGTTINSIIDYISKNSSMKIMSIDSPIEYLGSYTQLEYHNAEQLERYVSAIKKQDVDVVALNEIADDYVAEHINNLLQSGSHIATTIHTSSLANIVYKLKSVFGEIGYKELIPYINLIVYQDKFSKPCSNCKTQMGIDMYKNEARIYKYLQDNGVTDLFQSVGCDKCNNTKKQSGLKIVAEFLEPNYEDKQQLINMTTHEQHNYINKIIKRPMSGVILDNVCSGDLLISEVINKYGGEV